MSRLTNLLDVLYTGILNEFSGTRFEELVRAGMTDRDIKVKHPVSAAVSERFGFPDSHDDCPVEQLWRKHGPDSRDTVAKLNQAVARGSR